MKWTRAAPLLFLISVGCTTTRRDSVKTGMFGDDLGKLYKAYLIIDELKKKPTKKELEEIGFKFDSQNVERVPGTQAFQDIFGADVFRGAIGKPEDAKKLAEEYKHYYGIYIPFREIVEEIDRIYFTTQETHRTGDDFKIRFIFMRVDNEDIIQYMDCKKVRVDEHKSESAFAEGLVKIIDKYGKFGSNLRDLVDNLKDWIKKNRDDE